MGDTGVDRRGPGMLTTMREDEKAKVAVVGATGQVGRRVAAALIRDGHEVVGISRSTGVDVVADVGLDEVLAGVDAVVDVLNTADQGKGGAAAGTGGPAR
jgi:nucleoside-diphosphate-sugar epimerase